MNETALSEINDLKEKVSKASIPERLSELVSVRLNQLSKLENSPSFLPEFDKILEEQATILGQLQTYMKSNAIIFDIND